MLLHGEKRKKKQRLALFSIGKALNSEREASGNRLKTLTSAMRGLRRRTSSRMFCRPQHCGRSSVSRVLMAGQRMTGLFGKILLPTGTRTSDAQSPVAFRGAMQLAIAVDSSMARLCPEGLSLFGLVPRAPALCHQCVSAPFMCMFVFLRNLWRDP
jgi:hypothetical protein